MSMPIRLGPERFPALLLSLLAAIWCGCASTPELELPADTRSAAQADLESLFDQLEARQAEVKPGSDEALEVGAKIRKVGGELAEREAAKVRTRLSQVDRVAGQLPLDAIERARERLVPIERWSPDVHTRLKNELDRELTATQRAIDDRERKLGTLPADEVLERLQILSELSSLVGPGSSLQARYADQREELLQAVSREAEVAIENEDYEKAADLLGIVQEVAPEDRQARAKKCEVDGKVIVKRISNSLESGRVDRSMTTLADFAETDCFAQIKDGLASSAGPMAEAFGLLGQEAATKGDLGTAYQRYQDCRMINELLLDRKADLPGVQTFLKKVDAAYDKAVRSGEYGVAWGYLNVLTEFGPITPQIRQRLRKTRDEVMLRAVRGLTAYPFEDPPGSLAKVGDAVASKVVEHIFQTIPSDVRIVEREQLERILEECRRSDTCGALATADFIVQGTILDSKVETTEKKGTETRRVVTGQEVVPNPAYVDWEALSEKERKKTPAPPRTVSRDITEDVTIAVTNVRKVGIISVSYRVVEASSGRVLFTNSIQTKQEFQDEGRQGIQLGEFKQETDFVELPPDIEILSGRDGLADQISREIGEKLVEFLQDPENAYTEEAERAVSEGDYTEAARKTAYAIVLLEAKGKDLGGIEEDLKSYSMSSRL